MSEQPRLVTTRLTPANCPYCRRPNDAASGDGVPTSGDAGLCFTCGKVAVYENGPFGLLLRVPTEAEQAEIDDDPRVQRLRADWLRFQHTHPRRTHG